MAVEAGSQGIQSPRSHLHHKHRRRRGACSAPCDAEPQSYCRNGAPLPGRSRLGELSGRDRKLTWKLRSLPFCYWEHGQRGDVIHFQFYCFGFRDHRPSRFSPKRNVGPARKTESTLPSGQENSNPLFPCSFPFGLVATCHSQPSSCVPRCSSTRNSVNAVPQKAEFTQEVPRVQRSPGSRTPHPPPAEGIVFETMVHMRLGKACVCSRILRGFLS